MLNDDFSAIDCTPPEVRDAANVVSLDLLPRKSREIYERSYLRLENFRREKKIQSFSENVMLAYFANSFEKLESSTLWSNYSMLRATLNLKHNVDISKYSKLLAFLKQKNHGYLAKKSKTLTKQQFEDFLRNAPDEKYLLHKVKLWIYIISYKIHTTYIDLQHFFKRWLLFSV